MLLDWGYECAMHATQAPPEARARVAYAIFEAITANRQIERAKQLVHLLESSPEYAPDVGRFWHNVGMGDQARAYYQQAFDSALARRARDEAIIYKACLAESEAVIGNLQSADAILSDLSPNAVARLPAHVRGWVYYVKGYVNYQRGRFRRSCELYHNCLGLEVYVPSVLRELSRVYLELGKYLEAERHAHEGLRYLDSLPDPLIPDRHALNGCLGDWCAVHGRYAEALAYHLPALEFWQKEGQPHWICWTLNRLAEIELLARDAEHPWRLTDALGRDARTLLQQAWTVIEPTYMNLPHKSRTHHNLGWLAWHEGRLQEAEYHLSKALEIRKGYGNLYGVARTLEILARLRFSQHRYADARTMLDEASKLRNRIKAKPYPALKRQNLKLHRHRRPL